MPPGRGPGKAAGETTERLVQLAAQCPRCGKREARRIAQWRLEFYREQDPERLCETIRCKCGTEYVVKASAYQGAA